MTAASATSVPPRTSSSRPSAEGHGSRGSPESDPARASSCAIAALAARRTGRGAAASGVTSRSRRAAALGEVLGGHQREIVERERPGRPRQGTAKTSRLSSRLVTCSSRRASPALSSRRPLERQRARHGRQRTGAEREDEHVVLDRGSVRKHRTLLVRVDRSENTTSQLGAGGGDEGREREAAHFADVKRLGDRERPVDELVLRRDQLHRDVLGCERLQGERGLEPGDSGSGDDDVPATVFHHA